MDLIKMLHVTCVMVWMGNLLALTRFMASPFPEDSDTQVRLSKMFGKMYSYVSFPLMLAAATFGLILISNVNLSYKPGWFHMKLTFIFAMIGCDMVVGRWVAQYREEVENGQFTHSRKKFKWMHYGIGTLMIGILLSVYVVRDKEGELKNSWGVQQTIAENSWQK